MNLPKFLLVVATGVSLLVCSACGSESVEEFKEKIDRGKFDQPDALEALESGGEYKREVAAGYLAMYGNEQVIPVLVKHMHNDPSAQVRKTCLIGLLSLNKDFIVPEFIKALGDKDEGIRQKAVFALGKVRTEEGYAAAVGMLAASEAEIRLTAVEAVTNFGKQESLDELRKLYDDEDSAVRRAAVEKVAELAPANKAADYMIPALESPDYAIKRIAVDKLGDLKAKSAAGALIPMLKIENAALREAACVALGKMRAHEAAKDLIELFKDGDQEVRRAAAEALGRVGTGEYSAELIALLDEGDGAVREVALDALVRLRVREASFMAKLRYMANNDPHTKLREKAKKALEELK